MAYDSIYAYGDKEGDKKMGMKGLAVLWRGETFENAKKCVVGASVLFFSSGIWLGFGGVYQVMVLGGGAAAWGMVERVRLRVRKREEMREMGLGGEEGNEGLEFFFKGSNWVSIWWTLCFIVGGLGSALKSQSDSEGEDKDKEVV